MKDLIKEGLLLEHALDTSLAKYAIVESGVSVGYLKKLAITLNGYEDFSTAEAIKSLVVKLTKGKKTRHDTFCLDYTVTDSRELTFQTTIIAG